ncbi:MAG TPA: adenosylcobinamide-GDP ribazoletransferase [Streptosporangiaceae bacterium]|nr:adenosylcobinamide-GDP ribazoletransferase [Streptosporangiaceae bacterium]
MIASGRAGDGLRLAVTLLTVIPVRTERTDRVDHVDRASAGWAMTFAPLAGVIVGGAAALVLYAGDLAGFGSLLSAGLAVAVMAVLTRGLHLDGLADVADGLGGGRRAAEALAIMKKSDIGPFGVITLALTLLIQVAALTELPAVAVIVAAVTGRLAVTWACRVGVPAARPDGLGALVAGTVPAAHAAYATGAVVIASAGAGLAVGGVRLAVLWPVAAGAGLVVAMAARRVAVRRLGGITGDVLGALVELAATVVLLVAAVR